MKISPNILNGTVNIPSSKSEAHRAIICASFADGKSTITNVTLSQDIIATINGLKNMGAKIDIKENKADSGLATVEVGEFTLKENHDIIVDCNESGSTLRFFIPIAVSLYEKVTFTGSGRLVKRPLDVYFDLFKEHNIKYSHGDNFLPLKVEGKLDANVYEMAGDISSQFITGVMLARGIQKSQTEITITSKLQSKPYIDITQDVMDKFGVKSEYVKQKNKYIINSDGYKTIDYFKVMGDWSHAGFLLLAGTKSKIAIAGLDRRFSSTGR